MNKEDKRVIRTRTHLAQALIELSCAQGYEAVTVQEITARAAVNYRTFYRHYESKDDLLQDVLHNIMSDLRQIMPPPTPDELSDPHFEQIARRKGRTLYEFVAQNSAIFRVLLQSGPAALLPIQELAQAQTEQFFIGLPMGDIPHQLIANHMINSTFSFIQWWLDSDMAHTPAQMGAYAARLIMLPIRGLLLENDA
jgi:AcrR family transcriptional regulator